jgi:dehydrodolichyl diphosphate syntase complex subunit NUS1
MKQNTTISEHVRVSNDGNAELVDLSHTLGTKNPEIVAGEKVIANGGLVSLVSNWHINVKDFNGGLVSVLFYYVNHILLLFIFLNISMINHGVNWYHYSMIKFYTLVYYPNKSPQVIREDVNKLTRIPKRVSCILDLKHTEDENGGVEGLINNIGELTAWSISAGIPNLVLYEYNGVLINDYQTYLPIIIRHLNKSLANYFGSESVPLFSIRIPHKNLIIHSKGDFATVQPHLEISLLSRTDGKPTIVELTRTMSELAINKELSIKDISIELIDEELIELVGPEPDLLINFGPNLDLQDYPPWHIRLTEIYWEPDNRDVNYAIFLRALKKYSNCKMNVGK